MSLTKRSPLRHWLMWPHVSNQIKGPQSEGQLWCLYSLELQIDITFSLWSSIQVTYKTIIKHQITMLGRPSIKICWTRLEATGVKNKSVGTRYNSFNTAPWEQSRESTAWINHKANAHLGKMGMASSETQVLNTLQWLHGEFQSWKPITSGICFLFLLCLHGWLWISGLDCKQHTKKHVALLNNWPSIYLWTQSEMNQSFFWDLRSYCCMWVKHVVKHLQRHDTEDCPSITLTSKEKFPVFPWHRLLFLRSS